MVHGSLPDDVSQHALFKIKCFNIMVIMVIENTDYSFHNFEIPGNNQATK